MKRWMISLSNSPKNKSKTFCILPWVHLATKPSGEARLCCMTQKVITNNEEEYKFSSHNLAEIWNSEYMQNIRLKMINGEEVNDCTKCYNLEAIGGTSMRIKSNESYTLDNIDDVIEYSLKNNGKTYTNPISFDLRFGNLCNLKCRMCRLLNSSQIQKEYLNIKNNNSMFDVYVSPDINNWFLEDTFWIDLEQYIPYIKHLYFTGGEPTLIERHYVFLEEMINRGFNENIALSYNTNLTNAQPRFMNILRSFKNVSLACSIDGYGKIDEYIRSPSEWETISKNFETYITEVSHVNLNVSTTVQALNVLYINDLYEWLYALNVKHDRNIEIHLSILTGPHHLSVNILTLELKQKALEKLENLDPKYVFKNGLETLKNKLLEPEPNDIIKLRNKFKVHMNTLDNERKENLLDVMPELHSIIED